MTLKEKLLQNGLLDDVESGKMVVAKRASRSCYDTVVHEGYGIGGEPLYMARIKNLETDIAPFENEVFVITAESWTKMTEQNMFLNNRKNS